MTNENNKQSIIDAIERDLWNIVEKDNDIEDSRIHDPARRGELQIGQLLEALDTQGKLPEESQRDEDFWLKNWDNPISHVIRRQATNFLRLMPLALGLDEYETIYSDFVHETTSDKIITIDPKTARVNPSDEFCDYVCEFIANHQK